MSNRLVEWGAIREEEGMPMASLREVRWSRDSGRGIEIGRGRETMIEFKGASGEGAWEVGGTIEEGNWRRGGRRREHRRKE